MFHPTSAFILNLFEDFSITKLKLVITDASYTKLELVNPLLVERMNEVVEKEPIIVKATVKTNFSTYYHLSFEVAWKDKHNYYQRKRKSVL